VTTVWGIQFLCAQYLGETEYTEKLVESGTCLCVCDYRYYLVLLPLLATTVNYC
jgi:hypothetical protein